MVAGGRLGSIELRAQAVPNPARRVMPGDVAQRQSWLPVVNQRAVADVGLHAHSIPRSMVLTAPRTSRSKSTHIPLNSGRVRTSTTAAGGWANGHMPATIECRYTRNDWSCSTLMAGIAA